MKMYVGNCTAQNQSFCYRVPETSGVRQQMIPIGSQVQLSGDLSAPQIEAIAEQHAIYGLVREDEVPRARKFTGLVYSIDKPIRLNSLRLLIEKNVTELEKQGVENRKNAAVALKESIDSAAPGASSVEVETVEQPPKDSPDSGSLNETIHVERTDEPSGQVQERSSRKNRRGR